VGGNDFGFDLETLNVIDRDPIGGDLGLEGQGTLASDNPSLDATKWTWELSANESSDSAITFSAASANVPEPMTIALMGLGLVGISLVGTRRRTNNLEA
jgi:hypothetical protein